MNLSHPKQRKSNVKKALLIISGCIIIAALIAIYFLIIPIRYSLYDGLTVEAGDMLTPSDLVESSSNITDVSSNSTFDTSIPGQHVAALQLKNRFGKITTVPVSYIVADTVAPEITAPDSINIVLGQDEDAVLSQISVSDASSQAIDLSVSGSYRLDAYGQYSITVNAEDSSGNTASKDLTLVVTNQENTISFFTTSKGFTGCQVDGVTYIDGYIIANKTYSVPSDYGDGLTAEFQEAFNKMKTAAAADGISLWVQSGFRSFGLQTRIYNGYCATDGQANADTYSARPGYSEHQTGLAADINIIADSFKYTKEFQWLQEHCYEYGFILRYVENKTNETGYIYEPWHYRYVGPELAAILYNGGDWITLESYFGITSQYES